MKFKVDDEVVVTEDCALFSLAKKGDRGVVTNLSVARDEYTVRMENGDEWCFDDSVLELAPVDPIKEAVKHAVKALGPKPMQVKFKRLTLDAVMPKYAKPGDAGLDLVATSDAKVVQSDAKEEGGFIYVEYDTGLAVEIPEGYVGLCFPRSSISNTSLGLANSVGVVDSGYRGEIKFRFRLDANVKHFAPAAKVYKKGDRIGQIVIIPYPAIEVVESMDLSKTERGEGGWGSSGQ